MFPAMWTRLPWRNWLVTSVTVSAEATAPLRKVSTSSAGTTPQRVMNADRAGSPPFTISRS